MRSQKIGCTSVHPNNSCLSPGCACKNAQDSSGSKRRKSGPKCRGSFVLSGPASIHLAERMRTSAEVAQAIRSPRREQPRPKSRETPPPAHGEDALLLALKTRHTRFASSLPICSHGPCIDATYSPSYAPPARRSAPLRRRFTWSRSHANGAPDGATRVAKAQKHRASVLVLVFPLISVAWQAGYLAPQF